MKNFAKKAGEIENLFHWDELEGCFATDRIVVDGAKVGYMYREKPEQVLPVCQLNIASAAW